MREFTNGYLVFFLTVCFFVSPGQFYSYCFESLLPRDLDLYLVELDINNVRISWDQRSGNSTYPCLCCLGSVHSILPPCPLEVQSLTPVHRLRRKDATFEADDTLFRRLLGLPQEPAVIRISVFALAFPDMARGLVSSLFLSQYFDVPVIGYASSQLYPVEYG